ncbi:TRAP transporter substrate-binding protein DctP [Terasakiella pusilla]|uniref:TRAP transporter substrate-binding protein n=1 Tax=Terasakiella pusilla TaxID=64973 RepID=UPI003AA96863
MKSFFKGYLKSALYTAVFSLACTQANAEAVEIKLGDFQSTTHIVSKEGTVKWMKTVEERTGGQVTFKHFPSQQASKSKGLLDAVKKGIIDAALIGPLYHSDRLPLNSVIGLPGFFSSAQEGSQALQEMVAEGPLHDEFVAEGVMPIMPFVLPPYNILLKDAKVGKLEEWKGMNIRTAGSTQAMTARALGGAGVSIPGPETYSALERGRVSGVFFPLSSVPAYNLQEVSSSISTNGFFGGYSFTLILKKDIFDKLSPEVQKIMLDAGREIGIHVAKAQDESIAGLTAEWAKNGVEMFQFSAEEQAQLRAAITDVKKDWVERVGKQNPKASSVLSSYEAVISH